jgi:hypothetical protein
MGADRGKAVGILAGRPMVSKKAAMTAPVPLLHISRVYFQEQKINQIYFKDCDVVKGYLKVERMVLLWN